VPLADKAGNASAPSSPLTLDAGSITHCQVIELADLEDRSHEGLI